MSTLSQKINAVINTASKLHMLDNRPEVPVENLIDMLNKMSPQLWKDASLQFIDLQSGRGILGLLLLQRLHNGLRHAMPDDQERLNHILGSMLKLGDVREDMCTVTKASFSRAIKAAGLESTGVNVACGTSQDVDPKSEVVGIAGVYKNERRLVVLAPPPAQAN